LVPTPMLAPRLAPMLASILVPRPAPKLALMVAPSLVVDPRTGGKFVCLVQGCAGKLGRGWMLWHHFRDLHPLDRVKITSERYFPLCEHCAVCK
jgi:hypothetical protein